MQRLIDAVSKPRHFARQRQQQRAEYGLRSRGLKIDCFSSPSRGISIAATLFLLEYLDYRKSSEEPVKQGERSLLSAEAERLDELASNLAAATAPALENALRE